MILITGGNGQVGSKLAQLLEKKNEEVLITSRNPANNHDFSWSLKENLPPNLPEKISAIIHCAYNFDLNAFEENRTGVTTLLKYANENQIPFINISSVLAEYEMSQYGRNKRKIEKIVSQSKQFNLRVGVISSNPAMSNVAILRQLAIKLPLLPFPGITTLVYETRIEKLCLDISQIMKNADSFEARNYYSVEQIKKRISEIVKESLTGERTKFKFVNIPPGISAKLLKLPSFIIPQIAPIADSFYGNYLMSKSNKYEPELGWLILE
jgi:hypothetical protein